MAETPATLNLTLGTPGAFSPFVPGVARDYTTTLSADDPVDRRERDAVRRRRQLDRDRAPGQRRLLAGAAAAGGRHEHLRRDDARRDGPDRRLGEPADAADLPAPTPGTDTATLNFKQAITGTEPLRTGAYAKTLTFTLSTTNP